MGIVSVLGRQHRPLIGQVFLVQSLVPLPGLAVDLVQKLVVVKAPVGVVLSQRSQILVVVLLLQPTHRVQVVGDPVVCVGPHAIVEAPVGVVLGQFVQVLVIVALLGPLEGGQVGVEQVLVVHVLLVGQLPQLRDLVRHLGGVVVPCLPRRRAGVGGGDAAGGSRRLRQGVGCGPLALPGVLLPVLAVQRVRLRVVAELLPVFDLPQQVLDLRVIPVGIGGLGAAVGVTAVVQLLVQQVADGVAILAGVGGRFVRVEAVGGEGRGVELAAVLPAGVLPVAAPDLLGPLVRLGALLVGGGGVVVLLVVQDAHAGIRVFLGKFQVRCAELSQQTGVVCRRLKLFIGVFSCHRPHPFLYRCSLPM